ncbi:MAG: DEAD/DEAH box helicase family protein [Candidatus Micrarchaeota archaeon]
MDTSHSEYLTRKIKIDVMLKEQGWNVKDSSLVLEEVDTKQSNFDKKDYYIKEQTLGKTDGKHAYADYLLLDCKGEPLAVVEAKKSSKDELSGKKQAEDYLQDIKKKYKKDVFIYLTNGDAIKFWNYGHGSPRTVMSFHSQEDLEKFRFQNSEKKKFHEVNINQEIVDRDYQIEAVKRVQEGLDKGKRKFLVVMATGTGKTRVSMAIIDSLLATNRVQRVLFLADRKTLCTQAMNKGFKPFFKNESKSQIISGTIDKDSRLYVSTIQTLMEVYQEKDENGQNKISPGFFDLIVSDEAHRSIYNKWKGVFTYFDAIQIGLTATPSDNIDRDTMRFFDCENGIPAYNYTFNQAVKDQNLVDFKASEVKTRFQIKGIESIDISASTKTKLFMEEGLEENELNWDGSELEKKVATKGTSEAIMREVMENALTDISGTLPAKTIIFAITHNHAKRLYEAFNKLYPNYSGLVEIIDYQMERAEKLIDQFTKENFPRIAISVDMLDTGVDIPEVCNLVFAKPVLSKIKFWQMIGRGTRHDNVCKNKEWLPNGKKEHFLIFDFWQNFEFFKMNPDGKVAENTESLPSRIFRTRLEQYKFLLKDKSNPLFEEVKRKVLDDVQSLPIRSPGIFEHKSNIEKVLAPKFFELLGIDHYDLLKVKIASLMRFKPNIDYEKASFELKIEQLRLAILKKDAKSLKFIQNSITEKINRLPDTLNKVKAKKAIKQRILSEDFWVNPSLEDTQMIMDEFLDLMPLVDKESRSTIVLDLDDIIADKGWIEYGPNGEGDFVDKYKEKVEKRISDLAEQHPTIRKIKENLELTDNDLKQLEKTLNSPDLYITEQSLQKVYKKEKGSLVQFVKHLIGLYQFPDSKVRIEEAFRTFIVEKNYFNSDQVRFLRTLQTVFVNRKHIEVKDFYVAPFTNLGTKVPIPLFNNEQLGEIISFCNELEKEVLSYPS